MTTGDWIFFAVIAAMAVNHVLVRLPGWERRVALFWGAQLVNVAVASLVLAFGLPTIDDHFPPLRYVLALILIARAVQNNNRWSKARRGASEQQAQEDSKKAEIRAALRRGEGSPPTGEGEER